MRPRPFRISFGAAMLVPGSLALLSASIRPEDRSRAIGAWSGLAGIWTAVGPFAGGWLITAASWRWVFLLNLPIAAAAIVLAHRYVPESRDSASRRIDVAGAAGEGAAGLRRLHELKTGRLIAASIDCVLLLAGERRPDTISSYRAFASELGVACGLAFAPDGKTLATGNRDGIFLWDVATGKLQSTLDAPDAKDLFFLVRSLSFASDGKSLVSGSKAIVIWDPSTGKEIRRLGYPNGSAFSTSFVPNSNTLLLTTGVKPYNTQGSFNQDTFSFVDATTGEVLEFFTYR